MSASELLRGLYPGSSDWDRCKAEIIAVVEAAEEAQRILEYLRELVLKLPDEHMSGAEAQLRETLPALTAKLSQ